MSVPANSSTAALRAPSTPPPVIVLGAARSGTKLLRGLIAATGHFAEVPYDVNYLWRFGNESTPHDVLAPERATDPLRKFIRGRLRRCAGRSGGRLPLVEKTVSNVLRVPFVYQLFPTARFVFIIRDGRDVVESAERCWREPPRVGHLLSKMASFPWLECAGYGWNYARSVAGRAVGLSDRVATWGPRYPGIDADLQRLSLLEVCARQWVESIEHYERTRDAIPAEQRFELSYEQLVTSPERLITRLGEFLAIDHLDRVRTFAEQTIHSHRLGSHSRLDDRQYATVVDLLAPVLERWNYAPQKPASAVA